MKYKLTSFENMSCRTGHGVSYDKVNTLFSGTGAFGDEIWESPSDGSLVKTGDKWFHAKQINSKNVDYWIAIIHLGKVYSTVVDLEVPLPPVDTTALDITQIMRDTIASGGRIASLKHDWDVAPPVVRANGASVMPETVPFNNRPVNGKGSKLQLRSWMRKYAESINDAKGNSAWKEPKTGLINTGTNPEALSFGGNTILVKSIEGRFAKVWAVPIDCESLKSNWFTENGRLAIMKFTASNEKSHKVFKVGAGLDVYFPFLTNQVDYYVALSRIELWAKLPFVITDKGTIVEYLLLGDEIYGLTESKERILLYAPKLGYVTNWKLITSQPPPKG